MFRLMFSMVLWVTVGRWVYAEAELSAPTLVPVLDSIMEVVQIPTHDRWSKEPFEAALSGVREVLADSGDLFKEVRVDEGHAELVRRDYEVF